MKVGDKVFNKKLGEGKIVTIEKTSITENLVYGVEYTKPFWYFHSCGGKGKEKHCYWEFENDLIKIENQQLELFEDLQ